MGKGYGIPPLVFGERISKTETSLLAWQEAVARNNKWSAEYEAVGKERFVTKFAAVRLGDLSLTAISHSHIKTKVYSDAPAQFFIPISGGPIQSRVNDQQFSLAAREGILFVPAGERIGQGGNRSLAVVDFDYKRLMRTAFSISGTLDEELIGFDHQLPKIYDFTRNHVPFFDMLYTQFSYLDLTSDLPKTLQSSGLEDFFYRMFSMIIWPSLFTDDAPHRKGGNKSKLDLVCDFIKSNLRRSITLTELEAISGLSRRTLQVQFLDAFGLSPMRWVREQRLLEVRQRLSRGGAGDTVTAISMEFGLASPHFPKEYKQRFGEFPSETLANTKKRR